MESLNLELFNDLLDEFVEKEVKPLAKEIDETERFPVETVEKMDR
jgi:butyryl-CoA dehydrogenase